jgi:integrase
VDATGRKGTLVVRGKGEGSIYRRTSDNRWVAQIESGRSPAGRRRYARAVRRTRKDAQTALKELQRAADAGLTPGQSSTVETFLGWWLDHALGDVTAATSARYRRAVNDWIAPHIGTIRLNKLSPAHVQMMLVRLEENGLSPKSRSLARDILARALRWAEQTNVVGRNVARIVQGPKSTRKISDALTATEAQAVLAKAKGDRLEALAVVALRLGVRQGEALGLRWEDVDLEAGELTVARSKTRAGERTVPLVAGTATALREHRRRQLEERVAAGPLWIDTGFVFTTQQGKPIHPRIALGWWHQLTLAAGVGRRRFHAARHTTAVLLLDQGVSLETVSAVLGHSNLSITADVYARVTQDSKRRALAKLEGPTR